MENKVNDKWTDGDPYEYFMGRWSKLMATEFLNWLALPSYSKWLEIGCGTGALTEAIFSCYEPSHLTSIDPSEDFLIKARQRIKGKGNFLVGSATKLPVEDDSIDIIVSGLTLNFVQDLKSAFAEMKRVLKTNGTIAAYVWDYSGRMDMLRYFWDAAIQTDPQARDLDEGVRFPICNMIKLKQVFKEAGFFDIKVTTLDIETIFNDFKDYWNPFLGGQGPAPGYLASLSEDVQEELGNKIYKKLPKELDGSIRLLGRAIVIKGKYIK